MWFPSEPQVRLSASGRWIRYASGTDEMAKKETGNYPVPDRGHAISAKRLCRKQRTDGNLTKDEFDRINRKADKVLKADPAD